MEFNSGVSMFLPDSMGILENDYDEEDHEDMVHEQTNQNEIVELIMAAFEGHDEPSDGEDDEDEEDEEESLNTSNASHHSTHEHEMLNTNNNNNNTNTNNPTDHYTIQHELHHRTHVYQPLFSTPAVSTPPPLVPPSGSTDVRRFDDHTHSQFDHQLENEIPFRSKSTTPATVHYQHGNRTTTASASANVQYFDSLATADMMDPMQNQFLYQTTSVNLSDAQNQLNKFRILCNVKERKINELENRCAEYLEKYNSDIRALKHKVELTERSKYDCEQRYQSINRQFEELIENNNQLQRTINDAELRIQQLETNKLQMEKKLDDAETLIDSLHRKTNDLQRFETIARTQQDCEHLLASSREKHEQEIISLNEKLQMAQMNFQEKTIEVSDLRIQLESVYKENEKAIFDRMETINRLNQQLHDCQRQYGDLLTTKSLEATDQTDLRRQFNRLNDEKIKMEQTCEDLRIEVETLRNRLAVSEQELNNDLFGISAITDNEPSSATRQVVPQDSITFENPNDSLVNENLNLKERIDEFVANEKNLIEINEELQRQVQQLKEHENSITQTVHIEQITTLQKEIEHWKQEYELLLEEHQNFEQQSTKQIEQLREDTADLDKTKQLYIDVCQEKNSIEDKLRRKFDQEVKMKLDELHRSLERDFNEQIDQSRKDLNKMNEEVDRLKIEHKRDLENFKMRNDEDFRRLKTQYEQENEQEIDRLKLQHEKLVHELNIELDRLRTNDDAKSRLIYVEKEFEQLKEDYYQLNIKQKELLASFNNLENENKNLLLTIEQLNDEKRRLNELNEQQQDQLVESERVNEERQIDFKQNLESLQIRINNYENAVSQYEEYRLKLETNLEKLTQQRDTNKIEIRSIREMLNNKENELNQLKNQFETIRTAKERAELNVQQIEQEIRELKQTRTRENQQFEQEIRELKQIRIRENQQLEQEIRELKQSKNHENQQLEQEIRELKQSKIFESQQFEQEIRELKQSKIFENHQNEQEIREKLEKLTDEKSEIERRLQEANRALNLADSHLQQEIEKIKISLEQEYNRRYDRDQKQHQQELVQLRQQLTSDFEKQKINSSAQDLEEVKKMYRNEIDRLYHENTDLSQNQAKLIDSHQKQMQIMKKDLEDGYNKVLDEFQHEKARLQSRCEQLKQQINENQQNIEILKRNHSNELNVLREKQLAEQDNRNRQENLQNRLEHMMKLLEQENQNFNEERTSNAQKENQYQQTISNLQKKIADMINQHTKVVDEIRRELNQERSNNQKYQTLRPVSMPQMVQTDLSLNDMKIDYMATIEKLRELFTLEMLALLKLTCKMIFDVHHRVGIAHYMDNLEPSIRKQIQNEIVRSRNSMIKEIRRELFEKMTHAMKSQGVADQTIDVHIFELDRLLAQMAQDCLDSLSTPTSTCSSASLYSAVSSNSSLMTPQRPSTRTNIYDSSSLIRSKISENNSTPLKKSIESLYATPIQQKSAAPLAPHCHVTLDSDRRPKSASTILLASQNSTTPTVLSPRTHKFQRINYKNSKMKMFRSEDDLISALERQEHQQQNKNDFNDDEDEDQTLTLMEPEKEETPVTNVRALARQFEQKTNSLPDHHRARLRSPDAQQVIHHATARTIINEQPEENDDDRLTWPQPVPSTPTPTGGIKKLVRNGLKFLTTQPGQQNQKKSNK